MNNFLTIATLNDVLDNVDNDEPMIVLGDFNEDIMTNRRSVLIHFMQSNGFLQ